MHEEAKAIYCSSVYFYLSFVVVVDNVFYVEELRFFSFFLINILAYALRLKIKSMQIKDKQIDEISILHEYCKLLAPATILVCIVVYAVTFIS